MSSVRTHFEDRSASLSDRATVEIVEENRAVTVTLRPRTPTAVGVVLYLHDDTVGTVALDDPACVPAELGDDPVADAKAVDYLINLAVDGRPRPSISGVADVSRSGRAGRPPGVGTTPGRGRAGDDAPSGSRTSRTPDQPPAHGADMTA